MRNHVTFPFITSCVEKLNLSLGVRNGSECKIIVASIPYENEIAVIRALAGVLSKTLSKNIKAIDFVALTCYTTRQQITKEAAKMMNGKFYFYYFEKGCPSYVMSKA